jgi:hypothetical protein
VSAPPPCDRCGKSHPGRRRVRCGACGWLVCGACVSCHERHGLPACMECDKEPQRRSEALARLPI